MANPNAQEGRNWCALPADAGDVIGGRYSAAGWLLAASYLTSLTHCALGLAARCFAAVGTIVEVRYEDHPTTSELTASPGVAATYDAAGQTTSFTPAGQGATTKAASASRFSWPWSWATTYCSAFRLETLDPDVADRFRPALEAPF